MEEVEKPTTLLFENERVRIKAFHREICSDVWKGKLDRFQLRRMIKENHGEDIKGCISNHISKGQTNLVLTYAANQINLYDNLNNTRHLDIVSQFSNTENKFSKGGDINKALFLKSFDMKNETYIAFNDVNNRIGIIMVSTNKVAQQYEVLGVRDICADANKSGCFFVLTSDSFMEYSVTEGERKRIPFSNGKHIYTLPELEAVIIVGDTCVYTASMEDTKEITKLGTNSRCVVSGDYFFVIDRAAHTVKRFEVTKDTLGLVMETKLEEALTDNGFCYVYRKFLCFAIEGKLILFDESGAKVTEMVLNNSKGIASNLLFLSSSEHIIASVGQFLLRWKKV